VRNYYEILGVRNTSSYEDIKKSFRKKAKQLHPDLKAFKDTHSEDEMKLLIRAYEILSNPQKREEYDFRLKSVLSAYSFNYREYLKTKKDDLKSQLQLILFDLMHGNTDEAIDVYNFYFALSPEVMEQYLNRTDYLECMFLLAEEFDKRGDYLTAFAFLKKIYEYENEKPFFKHFTVEIVERLKHLVCFKIMNLLSVDLTIAYIKQLIALNLSTRDNAYLYKRIAELYLINGKKKDASAFLQKCLKLDQKLNGLKKLKEKIGTVKR
jgi:tetratricopeptide (TPR) repeat protein